MPLFRNARRRLRPLGIALLAVVTSSGGGREASTDGSSWTWDGWIQVIQHGPQLGDEGDVRTTWDLKVRWHEAKRVEVRDAEGALVGEIVFLADEGSTWSAVQSGAIVMESGCSYSEVRFAGNGTGSATISLGWLYYSLTDDDPLADLLPNATYNVAGNVYQTFPTQITVTTRDCDGRTFTATNPAKAVPLGFMLGHQMTQFTPQAAPESYTVEQVRRAVEHGRTWDATPIPVFDPEKRVLADDRMQGSYECQARQLTQGKIWWEVRWNVGRQMPNPPILEQVDEDWWPKGGEESNTVTARAHLDESLDKEGKFRFRLREVTTEPGHAMNHGDEGDDDYDLEFAENQEGWEEPEEIEGGWEIESTELRREASVEIESLDYGAWARLECQVNVDGVWYDCGPEDDDPVNVPQDRDDDRIADSWEDSWGVRGRDESWDEDPQPQDQAAKGDGIPLYEEYRGFFDMFGDHERLLPNRKELFVRDEDALVMLSGVEEASGLSLIYIDDDGWTGPDPGASFSATYQVDADKRVVNFNTSGWGHEADQHALHFRQAALGSDAQLSAEAAAQGYIAWMMGRATPEQGIGGSPATIGLIVAFVDQIEEAAEYAVEKAEHECPRGSVSLDALARAELVASLAKVAVLHEVAHGMGVVHHEPVSAPPDDCVIHYIDLSQEITLCPEGEPTPWPSRYCSEKCWRQIRVNDRQGDAGA